MDVRIENVEPSEELTVGSLPNGSSFWLDGRVHIVIDAKRDRNYRVGCVELFYGRLKSVNAGAFVYRVNQFEVVLKRKA